MAQFADLYDVGLAIAQLLQREIEDPRLPEGSVLVAHPADLPDDATEHVRVSLLWTTAHPSHVNDGWERRPEGNEGPPPLTLSAFFLVTTYGVTDKKEAIRALQLLGEVLRVIHDLPRVRLPLGDDHAGDGTLELRVVPMAPELAEKLFGPLQLRHRPFALLEASPVRIASASKVRSPAPPVRPSGLRLGVEPIRGRPEIARLVPAVQGVGGRVRIEGRFSEAPTRVWVGPLRFEGADVEVLDAKRAITLRLPVSGNRAVGSGIHQVSVSSGVSSDPRPLSVVAASVPTLDAPDLAHSRRKPLVLTGRALGEANLLTAWPDAGVQSPREVVEIELEKAWVSPERLEVPTAALAGLGDRAYRLAARVGEVYTPFVALEVLP
jgi:hypothetical protein